MAAENKMHFRAFFIVCLFTAFTSFSAISQVSSLFSSEDLLTAANYGNGQLSPNGKFFSYVRIDDGTTYIDLIDLQTGDKRQILKSNKDYRVRNYHWLNDSTLLLFTKGPRQYIYSFYDKPEVEEEEFKNGTFTRLKNGYVVDTLNDSPEHILYAYTNKSSEEIQSGLYRINFNDFGDTSFNTNTLLDIAEPNLVLYIYDTAFKRIVGIFFNEDNLQIEMRYRENNSSEWQKLYTFKEEKYTFLPIGFIDDTKLGVLTNKKTDKVVLQVFDINEQKLTNILFEHRKYDLTNAWLGKGGQAHAVEYYQDGTPQKEWLISNELNWDEVLKQHFLVGTPFVADINIEQSRILVYLAGAELPGQYHLYNIANKSSKKVLSLYPNLDDKTFAQTESFKVKVDKDIDIETYLTRPSGINNNTLLVMPHGGPIGVRDNNLFRPDLQLLANRGFTILRMNFRGSSGYGKAFQSLGVAQFGQQIESDISAVVDHVLSTETFQNICAIGNSYGAYSSMMLATANPKLYSCVVAGFGIYDLPLLFNASNFRSGEKFGEFVAKVVGENTADKVGLSPVYNADKIHAPVFLIAGKKDEVAGFEQSNRMRYMLERADKKIEHFFYRNSAHGHANYKLDHHELALTLDFLYRQLGIVKPNPIGLSKEDKDILAQNLMLIADGYDDSKMTARDPLKNAEYLAKAAEYDHPRAFFNLAAHYARGDALPLDFVKSREYYEKAAALGFGSAHERIAATYMKAAVGESKYVQADEEKALFHLKAAVEYDPSEKNRKRLARFYCIASVNYKNVSKCLADLLASLDGSTFYDGMRDNFAMAVIDGNYTQSEKDEMLAYAIKWYELTHISFDVDIRNIGIYEYEVADRYGQGDSYQPSSATKLAQVADKMESSKVLLGISFVPDTDGLASLKQKTLAIVEWLEIDPQNTIVRRDFVTIKRPPTGKWNRYLEITSLKPGTTYTVNVYSIDGKLNFTKTFTE